MMFCDLVGSTALSAQLDPEESHIMVRAYQETCATVIRRYDGHLAQHLGNVVLVYFGYPAAHEDDAQRAVRAGLDIVEVLQKWVPSPLVGGGQGEGVVGATGRSPLQVRIGIHTGLVVVGEIGSSDKREILALGETPNLAARLQALAEPDTVVISGTTYQLVQGLFDCHDLGLHEVKGLSTPLPVYRVLGESGARSRFEVAVRTGLTPLVGRDEELGLLLKRWEQVREGQGQVVLLSGEPGIGKSRLVQVVQERVAQEEMTRIEFRCLPFYQNTAFYPIIEHLQRLLQWQPDDAPQVKLERLQSVLRRYRFPQADTVPLLATLLSLPPPRSYPPLVLSPQKQRQKTQEALVSWLVEEAEQEAVYCVWEDVHWADPSSQEFLGLLIDQAVLTRLLLVLTFRPEFTPPWAARSHLTLLTLSRLPRTQAEEMVERVGGGKALPPEVVNQIVSKTDGVPLFVEELTKAVMESGVLQEGDDRDVGARRAVPLPLAIPATLQDVLMARLDRLATVKEVAQLGATLGREFSYELLQAVAPMEEASLQQTLAKLVEAEVLYQRGLPPQARYVFKHALIQDAAYQSLLKSKRQQYHTQIAHVLEEQFSETTETQPELLAHHYTEAGLIAQAIPYWQQAGQRATQRSAYMEAISHLTKGLELLKLLPDTAERAQQELLLQIVMGVPLVATNGYGAPEVKTAYARARELCRQVGETAHLFLVLHGLWRFYLVRAELQTAQELAKQLLHLAQRLEDSALLLEAHWALGLTLFNLGKFVPALEHLEQSTALYDSQQHHSHVFLYGQDPGVAGLSWASWTLWWLGYPEQALKRSEKAVTLAREQSYPHSLAGALDVAAQLHQFRRDGRAAQAEAEAAITLSTEQKFAMWSAVGMILRGWALAEQGRGEEGIAETRRGLVAWGDTGAKMAESYFFGMLADVCGKEGQTGEGLAILAEALNIVDKTGERFYEAELYRLYGELTLKQSGVRSLESEVQKKAEKCFWKAIEIARQQQGKSLELRAVVSLSRLWQTQGKQEEARQMLAEIYDWFTEGFDTKDLQEAKALLEALSH
ncbi:MAG TPA: adenylate/guanylate cyclase domain-containing protein [Candidatus Binatia bacterium]|nr:adenylate/guanylate cyclase domain-containing protein [Candidatus Binatia bacterium]